LAAADALAFGFTETVVFFFFPADGFPAGAFLVTVFFAGIGIVMPGIVIDCALAGAEVQASASAPAVTNNRIFTR
jgi:hypothetical protein